MGFEVLVTKSVKSIVLLDLAVCKWLDAFRRNPLIPSSIKKSRNFGTSNLHVVEWDENVILNGEFLGIWKDLLCF
jgi:hypothetical protein